MANKGTINQENSRLKKGTIIFDDEIKELSAKQVIIPGEQGKQAYVIPDFSQNIGNGNQALIYHCYGQEDNKQYIIKLYIQKMINEQKLEKVLRVLQTNGYQERARYVTKIIDYGVFKYEDIIFRYVVMPLYIPLTMSSLVMPNGIIKPEDAYSRRLASLVYQVNEGLKYLHSMQIYHGDIKPDNIMWDSTTNNIVIIDLGGSVIASKEGKSTTAVAVTKDYLPPEITLHSERMSSFVDYYCFGISLAEMMIGIFPKKEDEVREKYTLTEQIGLIYVPSSMPDYFKNLLAGLLYYEPNKEQREKLRWGGSLVDKWSDYMREGAYKQAATMDSRSKELKIAKQDIERSAKRRLNFASEIAVGDDFVICSYLDELVDELAKNPESGIRDLIEGTRFPEQKIGGDIYPIFKNVMKELQDVNPNAGETPEYVFWKFVFKYGSKKENIAFPGFKGIKNLEGLAKELYATLKTLKKKNYAFGEWNKNAKDNNRAKSTTFAMLFHNKILSTYLKEQQDIDPEIIQACELVEKDFSKYKQTYSGRSIAYMYFIAYKILGLEAFSVNSKQYRNYDEFMTDMYKMSQSEEGAKKALEAWKSIVNGDLFNPDFYAWLMCQRGLNGAGTMNYKQN